jgi:O-antigen/teichoic acid export membrane protein
VNLNFIKKDLARVLLSSFLSQGINIASTLFVARYLSISDVGTIAGITAFVSLFSGIGCLRYNQAIIIADSKEECDSLFTLSLILSFIFSILSLLIIFLLHLLKVEAMLEYGYHIYFVPLWTLTTLLGLTLNEVNVFHKRFDLFSKNNIFKSIVSLICQLPVLFFSSISIPLIGKTIAELFYFKGDFKIEIVADKYKLKAVAKRFIQFPIYETPIQLMLLASKNVVFFAFSFYYSNYALGLFSMAYRIFKIPHLTIGENIRRVVELKLKLKELNHADQYIDKIFLAMIMVSIVLGSIVYISAPHIISFILGEKWTNSVGYIYAFIPLIFLTLTTIPFLAFFKIHNKLGIITFNNFLQLAAHLICILLFAKKSTPLEFAWYYSGTSSACMSLVIFQYYIKRFINKRTAHA